jgi:hypothetical protein
MPPLRGFPVIERNCMLPICRPYGAFLPDEICLLPICRRYAAFLSLSELQLLPICRRYAAFLSLSEFNCYRHAATTRLSCVTKLLLPYTVAPGLSVKSEVARSTQQQQFPCLNKLTRCDTIIVIATRQSFRCKLDFVISGGLGFVNEILNLTSEYIEQG